MTYFAIPKLQQQHEWYVNKAIRLPEHINSLGSKFDDQKYYVGYPTSHSNYLLSLIPSKGNTTESEENKKDTCLFNLLSLTGKKYDRKKGKQCIEAIEEKAFYEEETDADTDEYYKDKAVIIMTMEYTGDSI